MKWAGIALTVVFYFLIVFFGIVLLAAVQLRSSGGATFDTWRLNYEANRFFNFITVGSIKAISEKASYDEDTLTGFEICLRFFDQQSGLPNKEMLNLEMENQIEEAKRGRTDEDKLSGDVKCLVRGYSLIQKGFKYYTRRVRENAAEIDDLKKSLAINSEQYADLIKGQQDFLAFMEMGKSWYQRPFVVAPYDLLVLLLVMFMGAFGGMVRLLRDYGAADHPNPTTGEYFIIPLIGAVVAIGGYVLAKTGLLLLSSSRSESSLSPFMISLVGIVSGLLAKEVIDTIADRGRKMLHGQDGATTP